MKLKYSVLFLFIFSANFLFSQDFSNKGTDFWIAYTGHTAGLTARMSIYITSDVNTTGEVKVAGQTIPYTVTAFQVTIVSLTNSSVPSNSVAYNAQDDGIGANKGINVTSLKPVVVYAHILNAAVSGSTLVLPTKVLGRQYVVMANRSYNLTNNTGRSQLAVVATQDNTTVEITPKATSFNGLKPAGTKFSITLNKGDVYQLQAQVTANGDLTGTTIQSVATPTSPCKPIAVFAGTSWSPIGCANPTSGDNLYQQQFPVNSWGKTYLTAPFISKNGDIIRILVNDPTTVVTVNGVALSTASLIANAFYEIFTSGNNIGRLIEADKPIVVAQYITTQNCDNVPSDPEMILLNSVEQTLSDITVLSARRDLTPPNTNITSHFINIIIKTSALSTLRIDNAIPTGIPVAIAGTPYSYIREDVTASTAISPSHRIKSDSGFIAIAYGYGNVESYGYNAGTNIIDLNPPVKLVNELADGGVSYSATCVNTPFKINLSLPYQPTKMIVSFNNNANITPNADITINTPVADSTYVLNGRTYYYYKINQSLKANASGTYGIKITNTTTAVQSDGCSNNNEQEITDNIVVNDPPVGDFTFVSNGCAGSNISFTDNTDGKGRPVIKWIWDFDDASTGNTKNPAKSFATSKTYNVKLTSVTDFGCVATVIKPITVSDIPVAKFKVTDTVCQNSAITFYDSSSIQIGTITKWNWDFGFAQTSVSANTSQTQTFATLGANTVTLQLESNTGCKSALFSKIIPVRDNPVVDFSLPIVCLPVGLAQFNDLTTISDGTAANFTHTWDFGQNSGISTLKNPAFNYTGTGPYNVKLTVTSLYGCTKELTKSLTTIYNQPKAAFTVNAETCLRDTSIFTDNSNAGAGNSFTQWQWNFGDGNSSALQNPKNRYATAGTKTIKLFGYSDKGCLSDTATQSIIINPLPTASFNVAPIRCETRPFNFINTSVANAGNINRWYWDMGNGITKNLSSGSVFDESFAAYAIYPVKLMVETDKGCKSDTALRSVTVNPLPVVGFILPEVCLADGAAVFTDTSKIADNSEALFTYAWTFNNNLGALTAPTPTSSAQKKPSVSYYNFGNYEVSLKITSNNGCDVTKTSPFTVNGSIPKASFVVLNNANLCANEKIQFKNTSTVDFGNITKTEIFWDLVNKPTQKIIDDVPAPDKVYDNLYQDFQQPASKTFNIKFKAFSGGATCVDSSTQTVIIHQTPKVTFSKMPGICNEATPRQILQTAETGAVPGSFSYSGSGVNATGLFSPQIVAAGTYNIQYKFTTPIGCKDSATQPITVWPSPVAKFSVSSPLCEKNDIIFTDVSVANYSNIVNWQWDFGDGNTQTNNTAAAFAKKYSAAANYNASLKVTTDSGCVSTLSVQNLKLNFLPLIDFSVPSICLPDGKGQFNDLSTIGDGSQSLFSYAWNFGDPADPTPSTLKNPIHRYGALGPFNVKLKVTTKDGCVDSLTKIQNTIYPQPRADFSISDDEVCVGDDIQFTDLGNGITSPAASWVWDLGGVTSTQKNPARNFNDSGTFNIKYYFFNGQGCVSDTVTKVVTIQPYPKLNIGPDLFVLEGGTIQIKPLSYYGTDLSFKWLPSSFLNSDTARNPISLPIDDITYTLELTGIGGCTITDDVFIKVLKSPLVPNAFSPNGDGVHDTWAIKYIESYPGATIQVFNRYGQTVFSSVGYPRNWDGTFNGSALPIGTYYYVIDPKNGRKTVSGSVTIIR